MIYRPPVEADTFLIPVTEGCTHNNCSFCNMYQGVPFRMLSLSEIEEYIWKQWKKTRTKYRNLLKLGIPEKYAWMAAMSRRGCWFTVETGAVKRAISNERLARAGFFDLSLAYESIQSACVGRAVYRTVRTVW